MTDSVEHPNEIYEQLQRESTGGDNPADYASGKHAAVSSQTTASHRIPESVAEVPPGAPGAPGAPAETVAIPSYTPEGSPARSRLGALWAGGRVTAAVAAGVALVGFLLIRGVARIPIFSENLAGFLALALLYLVGAVALALGATELMRVLLMRPTPRARIFFGWLAGIVTLVLFLLPLVSNQPLSQRVGLAFVNLITTVAIGVLVSMSAAAATQERVRPGPVRPVRSGGEGGETQLRL
ncbi:MAG: hypothetical protein ACRDTD_29495 [Pseudonocardiaceae bacterium]